MPVSDIEYTSSAFWNPWETEFPVSSRFPLDFHSLTNYKSPVVSVMGTQLGVTFCGLPETEQELGWGHRATYSSQVKGSSRYGLLGAGWFLSDFPYLVNRQRGKRQLIAAVNGAAHVCWFNIDEEEGWRLMNTKQGATLQTDTVDRSLIFTPLAGPKLVFHSFDESLPRSLRGQIKRISSSDYQFKIVRSEMDLIRQIQWLNPQGLVSSLDYEYTKPKQEDRYKAPLLSAVTRTFDHRPIERVQYEFHRSEPRRPLLKCAEALLHSETKWTSARTIHCKYLNSRHHAPLLHSICISGHAEAGSGEDFYEVRYEGSGNVIYVVHEGQGVPPVFL